MPLLHLWPRLQKIIKFFCFFIFFVGLAEFNFFHLKYSSHIQKIYRSNHKIFTSKQYSETYQNTFLSDLKKNNTLKKRAIFDENIS